MDPIKRKGDGHQMSNKLLALGVGGAMITVVCCSTPLLPALLMAFGLTGRLRIIYHDAVLLPLLGLFVILTGSRIMAAKETKLNFALATPNEIVNRPVARPRPDS